MYRHPTRSNDSSQFYGSMGITPASDRFKEQLKNTSDPRYQALHRSATPKTSIGLLNHGNECYMNCIFSLLFNIPSFLSDLFNSAEYIDQGMFSILIELYNLYIQWKNSRTPCDQTRFIQIWRSFMPVFNDEYQHDAIEFLQALSEECQREIYSIVKYKNSPNKFSRNQMLKADSFTRSFGITTLTRLRCAKCGDRRVEPQTQNILPIPLASNSLEECIRSIFSSERVSTKCDHCNGTSARLLLSISRLPRFIIFQLQRFGINGMKNEDLVSFPQSLDLSQYIDNEFFSPPIAGRTTFHSTPIESIVNDSSKDYPEVFNFSIFEDDALQKCDRSRPNCTYKLFGAVLHFGPTVDSGHYVTAIKSNNQWIVYDDDRVVSIQQIDMKSVYCIIYSIE